jgi:hypothetical protein
MSLASSLSRSSIALARDYESPILLKVNKINLHILALDVHDGERLLPVSRSLGITGLAKVHKIAYFYAMQDTPYTASRGL